MQCPNCQHWNEAGARFCEECGFELAQSPEKETQVSIRDNGVPLSDLLPKPPPVLPPTQPPPAIPPTQPATRSSEGDMDVPPVPFTGARLTLTSTGSIFKLGEVTTIGRQNPTVQIDFEGYPDGKYVSGQHARIMKMQNRFYIEDLGSSNHTYVNDIKLVSGQMEPLKQGDKVRIGKIELVFHEAQDEKA
jgi:pSer/pThr/pTyr-binding forkhead associated (FHA) protein